MDDVDVKVPLETETGGDDVLVGWTERKIDVVIETAPVEDRMRRGLATEAEESLAEFISDESGCLTRVILGAEVYEATTDENCEVLSLTLSETRRERRSLQEADPFVGDIACSDLPAVTGCDSTGKCVSTFDTVCYVTFPVIRGLLGVAAAVFTPSPEAFAILNRAIDKFEVLCPVASRGICSAVRKDPSEFRNSVYHICRGEICVVFPSVLKTDPMEFRFQYFLRQMSFLVLPARRFWTLLGSAW